MERESTALINEFDSVNEIINPESETVLEIFSLPPRNWTKLVDSYNTVNKRKFPLTAVECKVVLELTKKGLPVKEIFVAIGIPYQKYTWWQNQYGKLEDRLDELRAKPSLTDTEVEELHAIMRHPLRLLLSDIDRAQGICNLALWERFNQMADVASDMKAMQMKAKFKEVFAEKQQEAGGFNVQINLGGNWIEEL